MAAIEQQLPIPEFEASFQPVPLLSVEEFVARQQEQAADHINHVYDRGGRDIDRTYKDADKRLREVNRRIGNRATWVLASPSERRQIRAEAHAARWAKLVRLSLQARLGAY